jgi:hypothetical protein
MKTTLLSTLLMTIALTSTARADATIVALAGLKPPGATAAPRAPLTLTETQLDGVTAGGAKRGIASSTNATIVFGSALGGGSDDVTVLGRKPGASSGIGVRN